MYMVSLPPAIFIDRVMRASVGDDEFLGYGALAVLLARSADAAAVQDRVERDWGSIHDVTGSEVLVITPISERSEVAQVEKSYKTFKANGLTFRTALQGHWRKAFDGGVYQRDAPASGSWREESTHAVADTLRYFGLPERVTPCLLILVFWDHEAYLVRVDDRFNPYSFFKDITSHDADVTYRIEDLSQQIMELDHAIAAENRRVHRRDDRMRRLRKRLTEVGTALPEHNGVTTELAAGLGGESPMALAEVSILIEQVSNATRKAAREGRIRKDLADNLPVSLRAAVEDLDLTFPTHEEKGELQAELREAQRRRRLGEAVVHAAHRQGLDEGSEPVAMRRPEGWRAHVLDRKDLASSLIYAGISSAGDR